MEFSYQTSNVISGAVNSMVIKGAHTLIASCLYGAILKMNIGRKTIVKFRANCFRLVFQQRKLSLLIAVLFIGTIALNAKAQMVGRWTKSEACAVDSNSPVCLKCNIIEIRVRNGHWSALLVQTKKSFVEHKVPEGTPMFRNMVSGESKQSYQGEGASFFPLSGVEECGWQNPRPEWGQTTAKFNSSFSQMTVNRQAYHLRVPSCIIEKSKEKMLYQLRLF